MIQIAQRFSLFPNYFNGIFGCVQQIRNSYNYPITFEKVVFPPDGKFQLPAMPPEPLYDEALGEMKKKLNKRMVEARGYEPIHTELIHKQFGLAAVSGGFISGADFAYLQDHVNKMLKKNQFAVWRVDAPWLIFWIITC